MNHKTLQYFSQSFNLDIEKLPAKKSDRATLKIILPGIILGVFLAVLGVYEWLIRNHLEGAGVLKDKFPTNGYNFEKLIDPTFFDVVIILVGIGIIVALLASFVKYRKIKFDGETFEVIYRPVLGKKKTFKEPLKNYQGVELRIEFFQFGIFNRNRYIIELVNKKHEKSVPLYISLRSRNIRHIWKDYAKKLNMPALLRADNSLNKIEVDDLDKSIAELYKEKKIKLKYKEKAPLPPYVVFTKKRDKTVVKANKVIWDAYNIIAWLLVGFVICLFAAICCLFVPLAEATSFVGVILALVLMAAFIISSIFALFRKDKVVIKDRKIVIVHKFMLFSVKYEEIAKSEIEAIDVTYNPATGRNFLSITGFNKTIIFGKKLPTRSLRWVEDFLIYSIIK